MSELYNNHKAEIERTVTLLQSEYDLSTEATQHIRLAMIGAYLIGVADTKEAIKKRMEEL